LRGKKLFDLAGIVGDYICQYECLFKKIYDSNYLISLDNGKEVRIENLFNTNLNEGFYRGDEVMSSRHRYREG